MENRYSPKTDARRPIVRLRPDVSGFAPSRGPTDKTGWGSLRFLHPHKAAVPWLLAAIVCALLPGKSVV